MHKQHCTWKPILPIILTLILAFSFIPITTVNAQEEISWYSYSEGFEKAKSSGKPVFMDVWAPWCGPCQKMEEDVYTDGQVIQKSEKFISIKVNADENRGLAQEYGVSSIPTLIFLTPDNQVIKREVGYKSSDELVNIMNQVLNQFDDSNNDDREVSEDNTQVESTNSNFLTDNFIFVEIVISLGVAVAIILFLRKNKSKE